jgi:5-methylcytosine-specific restriction protein A
VRDGAARCAAHKGKPGSFADKRRGTATERGYGAKWRGVREHIMRRDGGVCRCEECKQLGRIRAAHEVDHIVPRAWGGKDDDDDLQAINRACHKAKTAREAVNGRV